MDVKKTGKEVVVDHVVVLKIRGLVNEPRSWKARYFARFAVKVRPDKYWMDVQLLFEMEWVVLRRLYISKDAKFPSPWSPPVGVWVDEEFLGDDLDLFKYLRRDTFVPAGLLNSVLQFAPQISLDPVEHCPKDVNKAYVYFDVVSEQTALGRMLFEIFTDIFPNQTKMFLKNFPAYRGSPVHRIAHGAWFEFGQSEKPSEGTRDKRPPGFSNCREGMLSLVNIRKSNCKSTQVLVTLSAMETLDPYQCPIGCMLDGAAVLEAIDKIETYYDSPEEDVRISGAVIVYAPRKILEDPFITCINPVNKPAQTWLDDTDVVYREKRKLKAKKELEVVKSPAEQVVEEEESISAMEEQLFRIRRQLLKDKEKFSEMVDREGFERIVRGQVAEYDASRELRKLGGTPEEPDVADESPFEMYMKMDDVPEICEPEQNAWLQRIATIWDPWLGEVVATLKEREVYKVTSQVKGILDRVVDEALTHTGLELYPHAGVAADYSNLLGDEINLLPEPLRETLKQEVCNMSDEGVELMRLALRTIVTKLAPEGMAAPSPSISCCLVTIINLTKEMLEKTNEPVQEETQLRKCLATYADKAVEGTIVEFVDPFEREGEDWQHFPEDEALAAEEQT